MLGISMKNIDLKKVANLREMSRIDKNFARFAHTLINMTKHVAKCLQITNDVLFHNLTLTTHTFTVYVCRC